MCILEKWRLGSGGLWEGSGLRWQIEAGEEGPEFPQGKALC